MENNNEKKLYTLLVYSENIAGILNQITAVFTRRQVNIESLNVSASSIKNIHKYTITVWSDEEQIEKINKAIEKKIDVVKSDYYSDDQIFIHEVALFKISTPVLLENPEVSRTIRKHDARMMEVNPTYSTVLLAGLTEDIADLFQQLNSYNCLLQYTRSGRIAVTRSFDEPDVRRTFATGIAGFSHVVDSISAIKYAKVNIIRDETGFPLSFKTEGDFPRYGNDDERADEIAVWLLKTFMNMIKKHHTYRNSEPTTSILTITSNVVYGKYTSNMPDGRPAGAPLAPGANPSYGAEKNGLLASLNSVAKLPYEYALDGISNTQTISPGALGHNDEERAQTLVGVLDGYFNQGSHHLNVNVFGIDKLKDAMEHPEKEEYQNFTIRVSGYAVKFIDLTREQQLDVIARQAHERL